MKKKGVKLEQKSKTGETKKSQEKQNQNNKIFRTNSMLVLNPDY